MSACWKLLASFPALFGVSEAVQIELIRLAASAVGSAAAIVGAFLAYKANRRIVKQTGELRRKRRKVRDPETEQVLIVEQPPEPGDRTGDPQ